VRNLGECLGSVAIWWQGRYGMPFACGFMLLLLLRSGRLIPRTISARVGHLSLDMGIMVWENEILVRLRGWIASACPYSSRLRG